MSDSPHQQPTPSQLSAAALFAPIEGYGQPMPAFVPPSLPYATGFAGLFANTLPPPVATSAPPPRRTNYFVLPSQNRGSDTDEPELSPYEIVQNMVPGLPLTTVFVGGIADTVDEDTIEAILKLCGPIQKWKRVTDPSGKPKAFGFCEYVFADAVQRALRLLPKLTLDKKTLSAKVDDSTELYLRKYADELTKYRAVHPDLPDPTETDARICNDIEALLTKCGITFDSLLRPAAAAAAAASPEALVREGLQALKRGSAAAADDVEEDEVAKKYQREEAYLQQQERQRLDNMYKDRLRKWESRETSNLRELVKIEGLEEERARAAKRRTDDLRVALARFDDDHSPLDCDFYHNREKWRRDRTRMLAQEDQTS